MSRERDIRDAIRTALIATDLFDDAWLTGLPEEYGQSAGETRAAAIQPVTTRRLSGWDGEPGGQVEYATTIKVTILCRDPDPQLRDERAELLLNTLIDAVDGQALVPALNVPQLTAVASWSWQEEQPPERRIVAMIQTHYLVAWGGFDTSA